MKARRHPIGERGGHTLELERTETELFVLFDGVRIAARESGKWASLDSRYQVNDIAGGAAIEVLRDGVTLH